MRRRAACLLFTQLQISQFAGHCVPRAQHSALARREVPFAEFVGLRNSLQLGGTVINLQPW